MTSNGDRSTAERSTGDPFTGVTLGGRYRIDGLIGRGGMASVYRGEDLSLGRAVAVKIFAEAAEGIDDVARRRSETALLASVEHHALVRLYDAARDESIGREFLVMELVDGRDLRQALRPGPVSASDAAGFAADLAEALHVIHERGIVHRDVKPANVLLSPAHVPTRTWNAKLADFGIARLIDDARLTRTGTLVGTPGYLSPEQVSGDAPGTAADVYALGLLLLEARTGRQAFPGPARESAAARLVRDPEIPDELGADWVALLRGMTAREATSRPAALEVAMSAARLDARAAPAQAMSASVSGPATTGPAMTGPATTVLQDASEAPTLLLAADGDGMGAGAAAAGPGANDSSPTAATALLPTGPSRAGGGTGTAPTAFLAPIPASASDDAVAARAVAAALQPAPSGSRRWARPAIAIVLLAIIAVGAALLLTPAIAGLTSTPTVPAEPLPSLPGELGVHLELLEEAVTR